MYFAEIEQKHRPLYMMICLFTHIIGVQLDST